MSSFSNKRRSKSLHYRHIMFREREILVLIVGVTLVFVTSWFLLLATTSIQHQNTMEFRSKHPSDNLNRRLSPANLKESPPNLGIKFRNNYSSDKVNTILKASNTKQTPPGDLGNTASSIRHNTKRIENIQSDEKIHVLYALFGESPGFLEEFQVSLKSVLLNSPVYSDLCIHIMADGLAYQATDVILRIQLELSTWRTSTQITITTYEISAARIASWQSYMELTGNFSFQDFPRSTLHTMGAYFRLFCHEVLPPSVRTVLYIDTDVVVTANLQSIWNNRMISSTGKEGDQVIFQWGRHEECSGFMLLFVQQLPKLWDEHVSSLNVGQLMKDANMYVSDQQILRLISREFPESVGSLPPAWDVSLSGKDIPLKRNMPLESLRPNGVGMLHINGAGGSKENTFLVTMLLENPLHAGTWAIARHYANLPWPFAKFQVESYNQKDRRPHSLLLKRMSTKP